MNDLINLGMNQPRISKKVKKAKLHATSQLTTAQKKLPIKQALSRKDFIGQQNKRMGDVHPEAGPRSAQVAGRQRVRAFSWQQIKQGCDHQADGGDYRGTSV